MGDYNHNINTKREQKRQAVVKAARRMTNPVQRQALLKTIKW